MPSSISGLNFVDLCCLERVVMCFWRDYQKLLSSWFDLPIRVHYSFQTFENLGSCTFGAPAHVKIDRLSLKYKITWFLFVQQHLFAFLSLITFICFCVLEREVSFDGKIVKNSKVSKLYFAPPVCKESWQTRWSQTGVMEVCVIVCRCVFVFMIILLQNAYLPFFFVANLQICDVGVSVVYLYLWSAPSKGRSDARTLDSLASSWRDSCWCFTTPDKTRRNTNTNSNRNTNALEILDS